jgi:hypothetical protein
MPGRKFSPNGNGTYPPDPDNTLLPTPPPEEPVALFMERDPQLYAKAVDYFEQGMSPGGVAASCQIPLQLARKIRNLMGEVAISAGIRQVARNMTEASQLMSERLINEVDEIPINVLPNALGVITDRVSLLSGNPSAMLFYRIMN